MRRRRWPFESWQSLCESPEGWPEPWEGVKLEGEGEAVKGWPSERACKGGGREAGGNQGSSMLGGGQKSLRRV